MGVWAYRHQKTNVEHNITPTTIWSVPRPFSHCILSFFHPSIHISIHIHHVGITIIIAYGRFLFRFHPLLFDMRTSAAPQKHFRRLSSKEVSTQRMVWFISSSLPLCSSHFHVTPAILVKLHLVSRRRSSRPWPIQSPAPLKLNHWIRFLSTLVARKISWVRQT